MSVETSNRVQVAAHHWRARFVANGIDVNDFDTTVAKTTEWKDWGPNWRVVGEVHEQTSTKLVIQHFRRRKNYRRLKGHRQPYTLVRVGHILRAGQEPPPKEEPAKTSAPAGG